MTVGGVPAAVDGNNRFRGFATVGPGQQSVEIKATDGSGNVTTRYAEIEIAAGAPTQALDYDADGNLTSDGTRTLVWNAENQLVKVTKGTDVQEFVYNGRRQRVAEKMNGLVTRQWVWNDDRMLEERDAANVTTKRFYYQGVALGASGTPAAADRLLYCRDHLDSVREVVDGTEAIRARYSYDAWGRRTKVSGNIDSDIGYTGYYWSEFAGAYLSPSRVYDPDLARWLSRDPIEEDGGINLYGYVLNTPTNYIDLSGLAPIDIYSSPAFGIGGPVGNHVYAKDPVSGKTADMHGCLGVAPYTEGPKTGPKDKKVGSTDIPGMSGKEAIDCIQKHIDATNHKKLFVPTKNDCHNALQEAIEAAGGTYPDDIRRWDLPPSKTPAPRPATPKKPVNRPPGKL